MLGKQGEWRMIGVYNGVCEGRCMWCCPGDEPLTLTRCHSFMKGLKGGNPSVAKSTT